MLKKFGIESISDFISNGKWIPQKNPANLTGFDIMDIVTWPALEQLNRKIENDFLSSESSTSIDRTLINSSKILIEHGRCLSYKPSRLLVSRLLLSVL